MDPIDILLGILLILVIYSMVKGLSYDGFTDFHSGYPAEQLCKMPMATELPQLSGPADSTLNVPREPYNLLGDVLEPATQDNRLANFTSECAYIADGQRLIEKTGTYGQVTNNYKHKKPDNGTTWLHELSLSFYK
jgi:hypothetical protein